MGSFIGHVIPGSFFILTGLWWIAAVLYRYLKLGFHQRNHFISSPTFSIIRCRFGQFDIESILAVLASSVGVFVEIFAACLLVGKPVEYTNMQHATMYLCFGLVATSSVARPKLKFNFEDVDKLLYLFLAAAFVCEGLLFKLDLFGTTDLGVVVQTLLIYTIWLCTAVTFGEMVYPQSVLLSLGRGFGVVLQGTWFWQAGFILYNPLPGAQPWAEQDHHQMMLVACIFTWHVAAIFIFTLILAFIMALVIRTNTRNSLSLQDLLTSRQPQYSSLANELDDPFDDL